MLVVELRDVDGEASGGHELVRARGRLLEPEVRGGAVGDVGVRDDVEAAPRGAADLCGTTSWQAGLKKGQPSRWSRRHAMDCPW